MFIYCYDEVSMAIHVSKNGVTIVMICETEDSISLISKLETEPKSEPVNFTPRSYKYNAACLHFVLL